MSEGIQTNVSHGSIAYVAMIRSGHESSLQQKITSLPACDGLSNLQFHTVKLVEGSTLLVTYDGERSAWSNLCQNGLSRLSECLELSRNGENPWQVCEALCLLRPNSAIESSHSEWHVAVTGLDLKKEVAYRTLHNNVWPGVIEAMAGAAIGRFDVFLTDWKGELYLYYLVQYTGKTYDKDMASLGDNPINQRWWSHTDPCQKPLPEAAARGDIWLEMQPVKFNNI